MLWVILPIVFFKPLTIYLDNKKFVHRSTYLFADLTRCESTPLAAGQSKFLSYVRFLLCVYKMMVINYETNCFLFLAVKSPNRKKCNINNTTTEGVIFMTRGEHWLTPWKVTFHSLCWQVNIYDWDHRTPAKSSIRDPIMLWKKNSS